MTIPAKGSLMVQLSATDFEIYDIQYNPTELSFDKQVQIAEIAIPGLDSPIQQFIRGNAERLTLELFCDSTEQGIGLGAHSVTEQTDKFFQLVKILPKEHAPPIVTFTWNHKFPGDSIGETWGGSQRRTSFTGVAESVKQRFTMFSPEGVPLRATVTLVLREYATVEQQFSRLNLSSPDRTHAHVLAAGETLSAIADRYYGSPVDWRRIAEANGIEDPRRIIPGSVLRVPKVA